MWNTRVRTANFERRCVTFPRPTFCSAVGKFDERATFLGRYNTTGTAVGKGFGDRREFGDFIRFIYPLLLLLLFYFLLLSARPSALFVGLFEGRREEGAKIDPSARRCVY